MRYLPQTESHNQEVHNFISVNYTEVLRRQSDNKYLNNIYVFPEAIHNTKNSYNKGKD